MDGISILTVFKIKTAQDGDLIVTSAGPVNGKYAGFILDASHRPLLNGTMSHDDKESAERQMLDVIEECRNWKEEIQGEE